MLATYVPYCGVPRLTYWSTASAPPRNFTYQRLTSPPSEWVTRSTRLAPVAARIWST